MNILIIDDDPNVRKILGETLKANGFEVEEAGTGAEAVAACRARFFNLALIDVRLPDTSGLELIKAVHDINEDTVAIIMTGDTSLEAYNEAMDEGAYSYITKPVKMKQALITIEKALEKQRLVSENKRLLKECQATEERFHAIIETARDAILSFDSTGKILTWNKGAETVFGYTADEMLQKKLTDVVPERFRLLCQEGLARFKATCEIPVVEKMAKLVGLKKDGGEFPLELSLSQWPMDGKYFLTGLIRDATARTEARDLLESVLTQLEGQKKAIDQFAIVTETDTKGKIIYVNDQFCKISKYSREELMGGDHRDVANSGYHSKEFWQDFWATIQSGKIWRGDIRNKAKDGTLYWEDTTIVPFLGKDGKPEKYLAVRANITDRKLAEENIRKTSQIKSEFASMVSHELRTPLTVIKESIELISDGTLGVVNPEQQEVLAMTRRNIDRLTRLVHGVLDFQKLQSQRTALNISENDINQVVNEVRESFAFAAKSHGLKLVAELAEGLPSIPFDRDKITQVLTNFAGNAIEIMKKGTITFKTKCLENAVRVSVEDEGPGIKEEDMPKLFMPFSQLVASEARKSDTTGLGLAICKKIIELHGGEIGAESVYGEGATFYFTIPQHLVSRKIPKTGSKK